MNQHEYTLKKISDGQLVEVGNFVADSDEVQEWIKDIPQGEPTEEQRAITKAWLPTRWRFNNDHTAYLAVNEYVVEIRTNLQVVVFCQKSDQEYVLDANVPTVTAAKDLAEHVMLHLLHGATSLG